MSTTAIVMMVAAMIVVWGGLVGAITFLLQHPEGSVELLDDHGRPLESQQ
ncbi:MAG: methionine/alanine import family NSS transporter small subunit [Propionibacteriaceae bacterium]|nr:methionine/alanine import family NSS transporter small subunit [Propionibacteriaceae bacterium]